MRQWESNPPTSLFFGVRKTKCGYQPDTLEAFQRGRWIRLSSLEGALKETGARGAWAGGPEGRMARVPAGLWRKRREPLMPGRSGCQDGAQLCTCRVRNPRSGGWVRQLSARKVEF